MIKNVGAYNFSQSMQFIQPRPAIVLINNGQVEYLRMPEDTNYIKQLERVPEHLILRKEK
jgi:diaminopimelate decarboxylase